MNFTTVYHDIGQLFILSNFFGNIHNGRFFCLYRIFNLKGNLRGSRGEGILSPLAWNKLSLILSEELLTKMHLSLLTLHRCGTSIWALSLSLSLSFFLSLCLSISLSVFLSFYLYIFLSPPIWTGEKVFPLSQSFIWVWEKKEIILTSKTWKSSASCQTKSWKHCKIRNISSFLTNYIKFIKLVINAVNMWLLTKTGKIWSIIFTST